MRDDGTWQVRDTAGSGKWHTVVDGQCTCPDYVFRHMTCKHLRAVAAEERALAEYCDSWNAGSEQARACSGPRCPDCGAELSHQQYYTGGRGYQYFQVCTRDQQHRALPA